MNNGFVESIRNSKSEILPIDSLRDHPDLLVCRSEDVSIAFLNKLLECFPKEILFKDISDSTLRECVELLSYSFTFESKGKDVLFTRIDKAKVKRNKYIPLADVDMMVLDKYEENR